MEQSKLDGCLFYSRGSDNQLNGMIAFHVDDLILGGSQEFYERVFQPLQKKYFTSSDPHHGILSIVLECFVIIFCDDVLR